MLIDLHCHTAELSSCSSLSVDELVAGGRAAGLDGLVLTEHDRLWDAAALRAHAERLAFPLLRGMEITTELGHVLALGLEAFTANMYFASALRHYADSCDALLILAHPARAGQPALDLAGAHAGLFDALEGLNGSDGRAQNQAAQALGGRLPLPPTGGSDCHSRHEIGTAATHLAAPVGSERDLIAELRRQRHRIVALR